MHEEYPRIVTDAELRFDIKFALMQISPSLWREWVLGKVIRSESAREIIVNQIAARLSRYEVRAPAPADPHGWPVKDRL